MNTSYVDYSIHNVILKNKIAGKKQILEKCFFESEDCFSSLDGGYLYGEETIGFKPTPIKSTIYKSFNLNGYVTFHCQTNFSKKIIKWYSTQLNKFGLTHEIVSFGKEIVNFKVPYLNNRLQMLATLCCLRYLQEEPFPLIVDYFYKSAQKYPKINKFDLFSLSHNNPQINKKYPNENHSLVDSFPGGGYGGYYYRKFIDLEQFKKNYCSDKLRLNDVLYTSKNFEEVEDEKAKLIPGLFKKNDVKGLLKIFKEK